MRYIPIDNGIQQHGDRAARYTVGAEQHSRKEARHTNATSGILVYDMRTQYTTAITRASQRPGACIACACVRALYYYIIIILLYYYIIIFIYTQYIQYTKYT